MERIYISAQEIPTVSRDSVACIGYFDGIHMGHQALLARGRQRADACGVLLSCICFDRDPWIVMNKSDDNSQITPFEARMSILSKHSVDVCYILRFDAFMWHLSGYDFIHSILETLHIETLICGHDFRFGYKGEGDISLLSSGNFRLDVMDPVCVKTAKISSSTIETLLREGNVRLANEYLGYPYTMEGIVIHGRGVGATKLGFPTANIQLSAPYVIVCEGVYAVFVWHENKRYKGVLNVGHNPTMNRRDEISIEVHIVDFDAIIYEDTLRVEFIDFIRKEACFENVEALITQLHADVQMVREIKE